MYLHGDLGEHATDLNPYMCSSFYAVDRAIQYTMHWKEILDQPDSIVIADRYISASAIHQGGKLQYAEERGEFLKWLYDFEVNKMGIQREDITIFLDVKPWKSQELMNKRYNNDSEKKDIHEKNIKYLEMCYNNAALTINSLITLGYNWKRVDCMRDKEMKTVDNIFNEILSILYQEEILKDNYNNKLDI